MSKKQEIIELKNYGTDVKTGEIKETQELLVKALPSVSKFLGELANVVASGQTPSATFIEQEKAIGEIIVNALQEGTHYAAIPGTDNDQKSLLQPGTDILTNQFGLVPKYIIIDKTIDVEQNLILYVINCQLFYNGVMIKEAIASFNSLQQQTRSTFQTFKDGEWVDKPGKSMWDTANNVLQMAQKRAEARAVRKALGITKHFTQDLTKEKASKKSRLAVYTSLYSNGKLHLPKGYAYDTAKQKERAKEYMKKHFLTPILKKLDVSQSMADWTAEEVKIIKDEIKETDFSQLREAGKARK